MGQTFAGDQCHPFHEKSAQAPPKKHSAPKNICLILITGKFAWGHKVGLKQGVAVKGHMTSVTWH